MVCASFEILDLVLVVKVFLQGGMNEITYRSPVMDPSFLGRSSLITEDEVIQLAAGCL